MEVHYADQVYREQDDGTRDPFRWSRFSNPAFITAGTGLMLLLVFAAGQDRSATLTGQAVEVGAHVASQAVRLTLRVDAAEAHARR